MRIIVCERAYNLKPSAKAICAIENEFALGMVAITRKLLSGQFLLEEIARILFHFIYVADSEHAPSIAQIMESIVERGIFEAIELLIDVFSNALEKQPMDATDLKGEISQMCRLFPDVIDPAHS